MSNVLHSRLFRILVCLVLVAAFLVNLSPLKAEATAVVAGALTLEGLLAAMYSMAIGVVAVDLTVETWNKIGEDLEEEIEKADPSVLEVWTDLEAMYDSYIPGGGQDPDDELKWAEKLKHALSRGLLAAIAGWLCSLVKMGGYEVESDPIKEGWAFYGEYFFPEFPLYSNYPYMHLSQNGSYYILTYTDRPVYSESGSPTGSWMICHEFTNRLQDEFQQSDINNWNVSSSYKFTSSTVNANGYPITKGILWSNYDILSHKDGSTVVIIGSDPVSTQTEIIEPSIYVGDIPDQIQNGDKDENNLDLPYVDPFKLIQSPETALNDVDQLMQQLQDGTITLDQYLDQVQMQNPSVDPSPDPSSPTTPSTGTDTEWEPPENPGKFALDLTNVFPFCIPFDLYDFFACLNADPVTPVINWEIAIPGGGSYPLTIDLSPFDSVAQLLRRLELLAFCIGLAIKTRDLIKG